MATGAPKPSNTHFSALGKETTLETWSVGARPVSASYHAGKIEVFDGHRMVALRGVGQKLVKILKRYSIPQFAKCVMLKTPTRPILLIFLASRRSLDTKYFLLGQKEVEWFALSSRVSTLKLRNLRTVE